MFFLFLGCSHKDAQKGSKAKELNLSQDEERLLNKFFRFLLLNESGIFTLLGSKPVTDTQIFYSWDKEDERKIWDELSAEERKERILLIQRDNSDDMKFYRSLSRDLKKNAIIVSDEDYFLEVDEFIKHWDDIKKLPISEKFILVRKESSLNVNGEEKPFAHIIFVNVFETAVILQRYYHLFRAVYGSDFDPLRVTMELKDDQSDFWEKINREGTPELWGLLYGFGDKNSFCFSWKQDRHYKFSRLDTVFSSQEFIPVPSIKHFSIPIFASFSAGDPIVKRYEEEREKVRRRKGKGTKKKGKELKRCMKMKIF
jgi:hypothetical protein